MLIFAHLFTHEDYMGRCLQLAKLGAGNVAPNPMVGAVLVYNDVIIGEGYHQQYGAAHAEVNCFDSVMPHMQAFVSKSTLYVSLEPCSHFGKTPPCADLIIQKSVAKAVIACRDPFKEVNGNGIEKLSAAGIEVLEGVLEKEAQELNKRFFTFHQKKRPYIFLKWAQTKDGFIAKPGFERLAISNTLSNIFTHKMRAEEAAILVGTNTALHDNPGLTTRHWPGGQPLRIVIDKCLKLPGGINLFLDDHPTVVINFLKESQEGPIHFLKIAAEEDFIGQLMKYLYEHKIQSLIVEGGSILLSSFINQNIWDEAVVVTNTKLNIQQGIKAPGLPADKFVTDMSILSDTIQCFRNQ